MRLVLMATAALVAIQGCRGDACSRSTGSAPLEAGASNMPIAIPPLSPPASFDSRAPARLWQPDLAGLPPWSRRFPGSAFEQGYSRKLDLLLDRAGNIYLIGDFKGAVDFGTGRLESAGQSDLLLAKFDASGRPLFCKRFGDAAEQIYAGAALDPEGNVLITGVYNGILDFGGGPLQAGNRDIFLAKLDPEGNALWSKRFGGEGTVQWAYAVAAGPDGAVVLTGSQEGTIDYGGLSLKTRGAFIFVVKFDAAGSPSWGKTFGGSVDQDAVAALVAPNGDVALGGNAKRAEIDGMSLRGKGMMDVFVARWSAGGELRWAGIFGDPDDQLLSGMVLGPEGDLYLGGPFRGTLDFRGAPLSTVAPNSYEFFLTRLDPAGQAVFSRSFPTAGVITVDPGGNIVIVGSFEGQMRLGDATLKSAGGKDIFVGRIRADGEHGASFRAGDGKDQRATFASVDSGGRVLLFGTFDGTLDLGSGPMQSESGKDLFLAKLPR